MVALSTFAGAAFLASTLHAERAVPDNLALGLDELVSSNIAMKEAQASGKYTKAQFRAKDGRVYATERAAEYAGYGISDENGRFVVRVNLAGYKSLDQVVKAITARVPSFEVTGTDPYQGGVVAGYVSLDDVPALANTGGVRTVALEMQPDTNKVAVGGEGKPAVPQASPGQHLGLLGTTFDQGVTQHRVDNINKFYNPNATLDYEGQGISIGFMSDSYNTSTNAIKASNDVANFDLPGDPSNPVNTTPVIVLQDSANRSDEGRGMGQIIYKMAPKAKLAFATAAGGEVNFAKNIRALAGLNGFTYPAGVQQGFAADVICDDISYGTMPFFQDGIVANAVDDVAAAGVSYFSSAGNDIGTYDYESDYRNVPVGNAIVGGVLQGTNINLAGVPPSLYQGGFHNFRTDGGVDLAQTVNVITAAQGLAATNFQWDDPYNQTVPTQGPSLFHAENNHPGGTTQQTYQLPSNLTVGTRYVVNVLAGTGSGFDAIVTIKDPNGNVVVDHQDTGTDEQVQFIAQSSGSYQVIVESFASTTGAYTVDLYVAGPQTLVTSDFNILVFRADTGAYLPNSSLVSDNIASNTPQEFKTTPAPTGQSQVQYVITRRTIPNDPKPASHFRWIIRGNGLAGIGPAEYITINTPNAGLGHHLAKGCIVVAAFNAFRPTQVPEYFTSPGPVPVYFDKNGVRFSTPEIRLKPDIGATDNANTSFFGGDVTSDIDTKPNFSGTSAAAPHAAAIGALVLQAHGGRFSVTPTQMANLLHRSTFANDLDPYYASATTRTTSGGKVQIAIASDRGLNPSSGAFNPDSISVSYVGPGSLTSLTFNPQGTAATGGAPTAGNNGVDANNNYFSNLYPGVAWQPLPANGRTSGTFVLGNSVGLTAADVTPLFTNPATPAPPSLATYFWTFNLTFPNANFTGGKVLRFTTGHAMQHDPNVTTGTGPSGGTVGANPNFTQADLFGGGVVIPEGDVLTQGMTFSGTTSDGGTFSGQIQNRIGMGWSPTTGFGFVNAEAAVAAPVQ